MSSLCVASLSRVASTILLYVRSFVNRYEKQGPGLQGPVALGHDFVFEKENGNAFWGITIGDVS